MFRIRELILVCVATTGLAFILGCPGWPPGGGGTGEDGERCTPGVCDDGDACTENDVCAAETCAGTPIDCDDANSCTNDSCNPDTGECEHTDKTAMCDDGLFCTATDTCSNGACVGSGSPCLDPSLRYCNEGINKCVECLAHNHCNDDHLQTNDQCREGKCYNTLSTSVVIDESISCPGPSPDCTTGLRSVLVVAKWTKREIIYWLEGAQDAAEAVIVTALYEEAASAWSDLIPLDIRSARPGETVDIDVQLCERGDIEPPCDALTDEDGTQFAGQATFPNRDMPVRQLIAVPDDLEDETVQNILLAVILHELGHNLGLIHSDEPDAIMYPLITPDDMATRSELQADDMARIQDLYGDQAGTISPIEPMLPVIPLDPDCMLPDPNGPDRDQDGLADTFEELVVRTDPDDSDTDDDGLLDGCEIEFGLDPNNPDGDEDGRPDRVEVIEGTPARTPVICHASDDLARDERVILLDGAYFDELGLEEAEVVQITNLRNGCSAEDVTIRRSADPDCTVRVPRRVREELCIFQLGVAVPLRICGMTAPVVLDDCERDASVLFTDGRGTLVAYIQRGGSRVLQVVWSLDGFEDYKFLVARVPQSQKVGPGQSLVADIWCDRSQVIEVGTKSDLPGVLPPLSKREDFRAFTLMPNSWKPEVWVPITDKYTLTEVDFVIGGENNCDPVGGACDPSEGVFCVDNLRLERSPEVLFDFERAIDPRPTIGGKAKRVEHPDASANHVLQFEWDFATAPDGSDPFVVLVFDGISVGPCDLLAVDVKVSTPTTVRLETKTPDDPPIVKDTRSCMMLQDVVEEIEIFISGRYALGEIAVVIERDLNEEEAGTVWLDNIRLIRGE